MQGNCKIGPYRLIYYLPIFPHLYPFFPLLLSSFTWLPTPFCHKPHQGSSKTNYMAKSFIRGPEVFEHVSLMIADGEVAVKEL